MIMRRRGTLQVGSAGTADQAQGRHTRLPYEPALDGLRGAAVLAVLAYHADVVVDGRQWFGAGFLGVDAFFVLSGFLITALLIVERRQEGRISVSDFWARRARRLLPALFLVIGFVAVYATLFARPAELNQIRGDGLASLFYVANWKFVLDGSSYFDLFRIESPLQHVWSLAIEEQWYVLWPLLLIGVLRWRRVSARGIMWISLALALTSAAWMAVLVTLESCFPLDPFIDGACDPVSRVYYGTDTRAQSLLVGAALSAALLSGWHVREATARYVVPVLGSLAALATLAVWVTAEDTAGWYYRGGFLATACAVALVILAAVQPETSPVRAALSFRPLRWLGLVSYGVYLWHWPLFVYLSRNRPWLEDASWLQITVLRFLATIAVATASYYLIERPIRRGALARRVRFSPVLIPATAAVLVAAVVVTTRPTSTPSVETAEATDERRLPTPEELEEGMNPDMRPPPEEAPQPVSRVLLVGDSVAYSMADGFTTEVQQEEQLLVWNQSVLFCELAAGARLENGRVIEESDRCDDWHTTWLQDVEEFDPDVSVLHVGAWEIFDRRIDGEWRTFGTPEYDDYLLGLLDQAIDVLGSRGATVVLLSTPHFERADSVSAREWTQNETWRTDHINELFDTAASRHDEAVVVDLGSWLCPTEDCIDQLEDGTPIRDDGLHFTDRGAEATVRWLAPQLRAIALGEQPQRASGPTEGS